MSTFRRFEREVLRLLIPPLLGDDQLEEVISGAVQVSLDHTGVGYYLTVKHPLLPHERVVCSEPLVVAESRLKQCGFVVFLENGELTLECHGWGGESIPDGFRDQDVRVRTN